MNKEEIKYTEEYLIEKLESEISVFGNGVTEFHTMDLEYLLNCLKSKPCTTPPPQSVSAEYLLDLTISTYNSNVNDMAKFAFNSREKKMFVDMMEEYRNQPAKFTPEITAKEEADLLIANQNGKFTSKHSAANYCADKVQSIINNLRLLKMPTKQYKEVLTILKGM